MDIRHIREFVALAEAKNYSETAEKMRITPSSLSRHIKTLEDEIGQPLFVLQAHKVTLTRYGVMLLPFARELLRVEEDCAAAFANSEHKSDPVVRLGSIPLMQAYHIMDLISQFQTENKSARLSIQEAYSSALVSALRNGELDFAFLRDRDDPDGEFDKMLFAKDRLCALLPRKHALAVYDPIPVSRLRNEPLLMIGKNEFLYKLCTDLCLYAGFTPQIRFCSHHADGLIEMVRKGIGIGMLMRKPAALQIPPELQLTDITPAVETEIYLARKTHSPLTGPAERFWNLAGQLKDV